LALGDGAIALLKTLPVVEHNDTNDRAWSNIITLSERYNLTPDDAAYLELVVRLGRISRRATLR
jgi:predicted nucleic acid-binding protein